jgi:hypothetical protein
MMFERISGKLGTVFYQMAKGNTIQKKLLDRPWASNRNPGNGVVKYREAFRQAVKGKCFSSRAEMQDAIRTAMKEVSYGKSMV